MTDRQMVVALALALALTLIYLAWVLTDRRTLGRELDDALAENEEVLDAWYQATFAGLPAITPEPPAPANSASRSQDTRITGDYSARTGGQDTGAGPHLVPDWRETTFTGRLRGGAFPRAGLAGNHIHRPPPRRVHPRSDRRRIRRQEKRMTLYRMFDASIPPLTAPPGYSAVAGYIGGHTPHVWTGDEWRRFAHLAQFPIWVPGPAIGVLDDPIATAQAAALATKARGWVPFYGPRIGDFTRVVIYDMELAAGLADKGYCDALQDETLECGYQPVGYGSLSTVLSLGFSIVWSADWDGIPVLQGGQTVQATQFTDKGAGGAYDESVLEHQLLVRGGVGPRTGP